MRTEEVTEQILGAWDEITGDAPSGEETETETPETETDGAEVETPEVEETGEETDEEAEPEEETEEESESEETELGEGEEEEEPEADPLEEPEIKAYLSRYQGDVAKALKGAIQLQQAMGRQGQEKAVLARKVAELEGELAQSQAFTGGVLLNEEQRQWVGEAIESGNPTLYVREAIKAGEYDLARAITAEWGNDRPYEALRAAQQIDVAEYNASAQPEAEQEPLDHGVLLEVLTEHFPELPEYSEQMTETIAQLGPNHPLVIDARSGDPDTAVRGVLGIYEVARASTHALSSTRDEIRNGNREKAASARKRAVVSSAGASPSTGEAPRSHKSLGPGLTLDQLEAEWEANS